MEILPKESGFYDDNKYAPSNYEGGYTHYRGYYIIAENEESKNNLKKEVDHMWVVYDRKQKIKDIFETIFAILPIFLVLIAIIGTIGGLTYFFGNLECKRIGAMMNFPYHYDIWAGCFLKYKDLWVQHDQLFQLLGK